MKYVAIDTETTGLNFESSQILSFTAVIDDLSKRKPIEELPYLNVYIPNKDNRYSGESYALAMNSNLLYKLAERNFSITTLENFLIDYSDRHQLNLYVYKSSFVDIFGMFISRWYFDLPYGTYSSRSINVAGKNVASFDLPMCRCFFENFNRIKMSSRVLDPAILYTNNQDKALPDLNECLSRAGIKRTVQHESLSDCYDVIELIRNKIN